MNYTPKSRKLLVGKILAIVVCSALLLLLTIVPCFAWGTIGCTTLDIDIQYETNPALSGVNAVCGWSYYTMFFNRDVISDYQDNNGLYTNNPISANVFIGTLSIGQMSADGVLWSEDISANQVAGGSYYGGQYDDAVMSAYSYDGESYLIEINNTANQPRDIAYFSYFCGRKLYGSLGDVVFSLDTTINNFSRENIFNYILRISNDDRTFSGNFGWDIIEHNEITTDILLVKAIGENLVNYRSSDVTVDEWEEMYAYYLDYVETNDSYPALSELERHILFGDIGGVFIDVLTFSEAFLYGSSLPTGFYSDSLMSGYLSPNEILTYDLGFYSDISCYSIDDFIESMYNEVEKAKQFVNPEWIDFELTWLADAVSSVMTMQIFPYFTIGSIVLIVVAFSLTMWWLKVFGGG